MPEHLSTSKSSTTREEKIDRQMEDTFPASDPPSYSNHVIGAPAERESVSLKGDSPAVLAAEKKVKNRKNAEPGKY